MISDDPTPPPPRTMIGPRTAIALYLLLIGFAFYSLRGKALGLGLVIVCGVAIKSFLHYWRERASR